jgi:hypothetical protein
MKCNQETGAARRVLPRSLTSPSQMDRGLGEVELAQSHDQ